MRGTLALARSRGPLDRTRTADLLAFVALVAATPLGRPHWQISLVQEWTDVAQSLLESESVTPDALEVARLAARRCLEDCQHEGGA